MLTLSDFKKITELGISYWELTEPYEHGELKFNATIEPRGWEISGKDRFQVKVYAENNEIAIYSALARELRHGPVEAYNLILKAIVNFQKNQEGKGTETETKGKE